MDAILAGLKQDRFDAAIGAITITAERLARVDFSSPAHRSGVAAAFARKTGLLSALSNYSAAASELGTLLAIMLVLLVAICGLMWALDRPGGRTEHAGESAVRTLHDGLMLGGGHDDHGRIWRQHAEDFDRPLPGGALDAREPRAGLPILQQPGVAYDRRKHRRRRPSRPRRTRGACNSRRSRIPQAPNISTASVSPTRNPTTSDRRCGRWRMGASTPSSTASAPWNTRFRGNFQPPSPHREACSRQPTWPWRCPPTRR